MGDAVSSGFLLLEDFLWPGEMLCLLKDPMTEVIWLLVSHPEGQLGKVPARFHLPCSSQTCLHGQGVSRSKEEPSLSLAHLVSVCSLLFPHLGLGPAARPSTSPIWPMCFQKQPQEHLDVFPAQTNGAPVHSPDPGSWRGGWQLPTSWKVMEACGFSFSRFAFGT